MSPLTEAGNEQSIYDSSITRGGCGEITLERDNYFLLLIQKIHKAKEIQAWFESLAARITREGNSN